MYEAKQHTALAASAVRECVSICNWKYWWGSDVQAIQVDIWLWGKNHNCFLESFASCLL